LVRIVYRQGWESYFGRYGLNTFEDFYYHNADLKVLNVSKRYVNKVSFGEGTNCKTFFIKRFAYCHLKDIILSISNFKRIRSQSESEYINANFLVEKGFSTYLPVCFGEQKKFGIEKRSFVITEKLDGESLSGFVRRNVGQIENSEKEKIIRAVGRTIRKIHDCNISLPDLYIWHLFLTKKSDDYEIAVIDLHRMKYNVTNTDEKIKNLGRLDYSLLDKYFDENLRRVLIEAYDPENCDSIFSQVRSYSAFLFRKDPDIKEYSLSQ